MSNICCECKKACGGCSWSEWDENTSTVRFEPVPGWEAKVVKLNLGDNKIVDTYSITACPLFEQEEKRKNTTGEVDDDAFRRILDTWKWRDEHGL